jgi:D-alanyl-D-alanine carboxypeptidase
MKKIRFPALILILALLLPQFALAFEQEMVLDAKAAILVDAAFGDVLYAQNADERVYPASTTKIMTALLVIENIEMGGSSLTTVVTATESAIASIPPRSSHQSIRPGEQLTLEQLLYCLMVASANDASNVLAEAVGGSLEDFYALMNSKAQALGLSGTHYMNAHGLHHDEHYTTARDLAVLASYAMTKPLFRTIVAAPVYTVPATNVSAQRTLHTTNYLLSHRIIPGYLYSSATGIKTGTTDEAGYCLVSSAQKGERELIAVIMGTELKRDAANLVIDRPYLSDSSRLLEWGFAGYSRREILSTDDLIGELPVSLSSVADYVVAHPSGSLEATIPRDLARESFQRTVTWLDEAVEAPVVKGQVLGTITVSYEDIEYGTLNLVALSDVEASPWKVFWKDTGAAVLQIAIFSFLGVVLIFVVILLLRSHKRKKLRLARQAERERQKTE